MLMQSDIYRLLIYPVQDYCLVISIMSVCAKIGICSDVTAASPRICECKIKLYGHSQSLPSTDVIMCGLQVANVFYCVFQPRGRQAS